jgi:hypothetical protein
MVVAIIVALATIQSTQASIDFWLEKPAALQQGLNGIKVYAKYGGGMDRDFDLIIRFSNASFSSQTEMPYTTANNGQTVILKYVLHKEESNEKMVYFNINSTESVSVSVTLQQTSVLAFIKANSFYPTQLTYTWDTTNGTFRCNYSQ